MSESDLKPLDRFVEFVYESTRIFRGFSMALDARKLLFALAAVVLWGLGAMFINVVNTLIPILIAAGVVGTLILFVVLAKAESEMSPKNSMLAYGVGTFVIWGAAVILYFVTRENSRVPVLWVFQPLWGLAILSFFGTAICRIAAVNASTEDSISFREALRFALKKLATSVWTLLVPVMAVLAFVAALAVFGSIGRIPGFGHVWYGLIGVIYILFLLVGLFFAVVLLVYLPGLALFQPAIAVEGSDSFDAISRAYSYIFGRPWRLAFYSILAFVYARIVLSVVALVVVWAGRITNSGLARGVGEKMASDASKLDLGVIFGGFPYIATGYGPLMRAANHILTGRVHDSFKDVEFGGWLILFWQYILLALFMAFGLSLFYSLVTQIYLLMRKANDSTAFEEVYAELPEEEQFAGEFAEKPAPVDVKAPPAKPTTEKAEKTADVDEPIDLAGGEDKNADK